MRIVYFWSEHGFLPFRAKKAAAGWDLVCCAEKDWTIQPMDTVIVGTGIHLRMPPGIHAELKTRSSAAANGFLVGGGIIDSDYTGEIKVVIHSLRQNSFLMSKNARIAQMVFYGPGTEEVELQEMNEVDFKFFTPTDRGDQGFGSTGQ